jgi:DNA repair ATPase RecN
MDTESILALSQGAKFYRADLHIHSFEGSHDVTDKSATPEQIVATSLAEGLSIIAVTDHNEIINVPRAVKAAEGKNILVVPGVELSMSDCHLLAYFPTYELLEKFFGSLSIADRRAKTCRCQTGMIDCLNKVAEYGGFAVLAHVDAEAGLEKAMPTSTPAKIDILCHKAMTGIEVIRADSPIHYSDRDQDASRKQIGRLRQTRLKQGSRQFLARVLNSDSHTIASLGRNAKGDRRVTRYKMESPSFDGLKIALRDADARVRIEEEIPPTLPTILGIGLDGGFLPGLAIRFSRNLNCIIGGRGSGKSTTFEALRLLTGENPNNTVVDSDVWPDEVTLIFEDEAGQRHIFGRTKDGTLQNLSDPIDGPDRFRIESYGQGETHNISQRAQDDPLALLTFIDRLVDVETWLAIEDVSRTELNELRPEIEKAEEKVASIPETERQLKLKRSQLKTFKDKEGEAVIKLQQRLENERRYRSNIIVALKELPNATDQSKIGQIADRIKTAAEETPEVGAAEFASIVTATDSYKTTVDGVAGSLRGKTDAYVSQIFGLLETWKSKETQTLAEIESKKRELTAAGIRLDMPFIQKLVGDESRLTQNLGILNKWKPHLKELNTKRADLRRKRWEARARVAATRSAFAQKASLALSQSLGDLQVSLKFTEGACAPDAERLIVEAMGWRTLQHLKARALIEDLTLQALLVAVDRHDTKVLLNLKSADGKPVFSSAEADSLLEKLSERQLRWDLETCAVHDLPRLNVTKAYSDKTGNPAHVTRDFKKLSLGQQQSVLLALMLTSESTAPLIIDQPEDNLDGEFIYQSIVPVLRQAKERRQIIIVTHNANVTVLGDAEQIIAMKATNDKGLISSRGSIDDTLTREAACSILEGSREAFDRRAQIYGSVG